MHGTELSKGLVDEEANSLPLIKDEGSAAPTAKHSAPGKLGGLCQAYNKIFSHFPLTSVLNFIYWCAQFDYLIIINN